ncbi:hypothetical protein JCM11491_003760 [Sporobolomyces phaffii]
MDGEAIYSALVANANAVNPIPILPLLDTPNAAARVAPELLGDHRSEAIHQALVRAAVSATALPVESIPTAPPPPVPTAKLSALAAANASQELSRAYSGFITSSFAALPSAASILIGVFLILLSLACLGAGARSLYVGRDLGRTYGSTERKGWLRGGVGGIFFGSTALGLLVTLLVLLIVSRQSETTLSAWGLVSILVLCSLPGAVAGGRWSWFSRSSVALIGSTSLALLIVVSVRISSTLTRLIPVLVLIALSQVSVHLRFAQRYSLPILAALFGSFLFVLGIDVFRHLGFIDALGLFVRPQGVGTDEAGRVVVEWSTSRAKGVVAGWWILSVASACWQTWWGLGIEGQELWNDYLARYIAPSDPLGTHLPPLNFFARVRSRFSSRPSRPNRHETFTRLSHRHGRRTSPWDEIEEDVDNDDDDDKVEYEKGLAGIGLEGRKKRRGSDTWDSDIETLASRHTGLEVLDRPRASRRGSSKPAQYGAVDSSDEEEEDDPEKGRPDLDSESINTFGAFSGTTIASRSRKGGASSALAEEREEEHEKAFDGRADDPSAGDDRSRRLPVETSTRLSTSSRPDPLAHDFTAHDTGRKRGSLFARFFSPSTRTSPNRSPGPRLRPPPNLEEHDSGRVAATPSLIAAIERVNAAQRQARDSLQTRHELDPGTGQSDSRDSTEAADRNPGRAKRASMDEFWKAVVEQASTSTTTSRTS